jgi:L-alanine-DL-glutamate epimerase-like enolase superfamily enzyme
MKIAHIEAFGTRLPVAAELKISRGSVASVDEGAPHVYVRVTSDTGAVGWGEARPSPRWSYETPESVVSSIERYLAPAIVGLPVDDEAAVRQVMDVAIAPSVHTGQPIAKSAIDMALCDLVSRTLHQPLWAYLRGALGMPVAEPPESIGLTYLVTSSDPEEVSRQVAAAAAAGYEGFKIKIGLDPARDVAVLDAASQAAAGAFLWADANQAYGLEKALELGRAAERLGIDVLEQPLPAAALSAQVELCKALDVAIALDESVYDLLQLEELIRLKALDALVVKVSKMAGPRSAARCAARALAAGITVLGSGLTESRLGLSASVALMAALGVDRPADFNGPQFLADDALPGPMPKMVPRWPLPTAPGIGLAPDEEKLRRYAGK